MEYPAQEIPWPRIFQPYGLVEDRSVVRGVGISHEIAGALELQILSRLHRGCETLDIAVVVNMQ